MGWGSGDYLFILIIEFFAILTIPVLGGFFLLRILGQLLSRRFDTSFLWRGHVDGGRSRDDARFEIADGTRERCVSGVGKGELG